MIYFKNGIIYRCLKNIFYKKRIVIITALLFCAVFFFLVFGLFKVKNVTDLSNDWEISTNSSQKNTHISNLKHLGNHSLSETLHISKILEEAGNSDTLLLRSSHQYIDVYLDEVKLFAGPPAAAKDPGIALYFIPLPADYGGKTLHIEISSPYHYFARTVGPVYLGTTSSLYAYIFSEAFPNIFYFIICLITGLFLVIYAVYSHFNNVNHTDKLYWGIFSILWGAYCISWDNIACLFFSPIVISRVSTLLHIFYILPFFMYLRLNFKICRKLLSSMSVILCCIDITICLLLFLSVIDYPNAVLINNYILAAVLTPVFIIAFFEFKKGNPLIRFISPTILLLIVGCIGTILEYFKIAKGMFFYLFSIFIFITFNWAYHIKKILNQYIQKKKEIETLELKNTLILDKYNEMQSSLEKIHMIHHEMNHHIAAIQILCKEGNIDAINGYLLSISPNVLADQNMSYCRHPIVDCILFNYAAQAKKMNIHLDCTTNIPKSLSISDADLCSLLSNMLDNAIEACSLSVYKWIIFEMLLKDKLLVISCKNSYIGAVSHKNGKIATRKQEKNLHGYGISVMESIARKYGSMLVILYDSEEFTVKTALQLS